MYVLNQNHSPENTSLWENSRSCRTVRRQYAGHATGKCPAAPRGLRLHRVEQRKSGKLGVQAVLANQKWVTSMSDQFNKRRSKDLICNGMGTGLAVKRLTTAERRFLHLSARDKGNIDTIQGVENQ